MHILFATLISLDGRRGNVIHVLELAEGLARCGAHVTLIAPGTPHRPVKGIELICVGQLTRRFTPAGIMSVVFAGGRLLYHVLRLSRQAHVLYCRDNLLGACLSLLGPLIRLPMVFEVNGLKADEKRMYSARKGGRTAAVIADAAERIAVCTADAIICVTDGIRTILTQKYRLPAHRSSVVPNGANLELFVPNADPKKQADLRRSFDLHESDAVILYLGTLLPWHDLSTLLEAVGCLSVKGRSPVLLIVGDGTQRSQIEDQARRLPAGRRVCFAGAVPYVEVPPYVCLADVCVMPFTRARNEKIGLSPIKLYTYLASGKPLVASRIRGFEFLEELGLGTLVPCGDANAFASALKAWLEDPQRCKRVAPKARRYAEQHCGWDRTARSVLDVCSRVAKDAAPATVPA